MVENFTPGPWRVEVDSPLRVLACDPRVTVVCPDLGPASNDQCLANARLIAAAPTLYAALVNLRARFHRCCIHAGNDEATATASCAQADAAIAQATGAS